MLQSVSIVNFEHVIAGWAIICSADYTVVNSSISLVNMSDTFIDMIRLLYLKLCLKKKKLYGPFLWMGFNCLKATEPPRGDSLLFTTKFLESPGTHLIDLRRIKG